MKVTLSAENECDECGMKPSLHVEANLASINLCHGCLHMAKAKAKRAWRAPKKDPFDGAQMSYLAFGDTVAYPRR